MHSVIFFGSISNLTPSSSKTCDEPDFDDKALFPCFAITAPAPAATNEAAVDILYLPDPLPPVPQVSIALSGAETLEDFSLITLVAAVISSIFSPLSLRPRRNFSICFSLALPSKI